jgi:starvation-inducible DNA-binding protein
MNELINQLKVVLASTFAFSLKAQNFHWNVEGPHFSAYHDLFGKIYEDAFGAVDEIAERIRTLDQYAPGSMSRFAQLSVVDDQINIPVARAMIQELQSDNVKIIAELTKGFNLASKAGKEGLADYFAGRIDVHEKHGWMLRATAKTQ